MRLKKAILEFLSDELHFEAANMMEETSFAELGVTPAQLPELLHRLQDALGIILPEEKLSEIGTIADLLELVDENEPDY